MDASTLDSLRAALAAAPDNLDLRLVVVAALAEHGDAEEASRLVEDLTPDEVTDPAKRRLVTRILVDARRGEDALRWSEHDGDGDASAEDRLLRARVLEALGRRDEGMELYAAAVAANPALEDLELKKRLRGKIRTFEPKREGGPRLTVLANDDTDQSEMGRLLMPTEETVTFADVGGLDEIKKQIRKKIILPFQKPSLFQRFKKRIGGGILLYGPPGCGKTLLARATAGECDASFFNVAIADILDMYIGESERKLHAIFDKARQSTPSVLFFDEIEALGGKRQYTRESTSSKLVSQFLSEMDGFAQDNAGVLILGATNVPWAVDPAFRRPGRFDRLLFVPPPDVEARRAILEILLDDRPIEEGIDLEPLVRQTSGYSGADLRNILETAADEAIEESIESEREIPISTEHLRAALRQVKATTLEWLTTARNYARYANEAGQYDEVLEFLDKYGKARR